MTRLKNSLMAGTSRPVTIIIVVNDKGGQGKSLASQAVAEHAFLHEMPLAIAQIDAQQRLAKALGRSVLTIAVDPKAARRDPAAEIRAYTPLYGLVERAASKRVDVLIDTGANQAIRLFYWTGLVDLAEDLAAWGCRVTLVAVYTAEAEGMRKAAEAVRLGLERFPDARLVLLRNERDGLITDLHPSSEAAEVHASEIQPLEARGVVVRMPAVTAGAWRPFEAAGCRIVKAVEMPVERVMALTGLPRPEAKIVRGDVAGFAAEVFAELDAVLPWGTGGAHDA